MKNLWNCLLRNRDENLENIKAIIIPTCDDFENALRADTAMDFVNKYNLPKKCIIAGSGPDTNIALGYMKNPDNRKLDFHKGLYNKIMKETDWMIGMDINSLNSVENILEVFPNGIKGEYGLVSYPLHLMRFKRIIKDAQAANKISKDINVHYVLTKQRMKWISHEVLSHIKYFIKSKKKYFPKKQQ